MLPSTSCDASSLFLIGCSRHPNDGVGYGVFAEFVGHQAADPDLDEGSRAMAASQMDHRLRFLESQVTYWPHAHSTHLTRRRLLFYCHPFQLLKACAT